VPGAINTNARGIDGDNIVGYYYDFSYNAHGFLAVIPEPATLSLLAVGMLMACRRRREEDSVVGKVLSALTRLQGRAWQATCG